MSKALYPLIATMFMALFLSTACAEQGQDNEAAAEADTATTQEPTNGEMDKTAEDTVSLMDQPVDFSTPEAAEKTLQDIREQEGEAAYMNLKNAIDYLLFYDLSVRNDKTKLYKKLDGLTPKQISAKIKRK